MGFAVLAIPLVGSIVWIGWQGANTEANYWQVSGAPCPQLSPAAFAAQPIQASQSFQYGDVVFARAFGWSSCGQKATLLGLETLTICQFTNPGIVAVNTGKSLTYFAPGISQPATVSASPSRGEVRCVIGSHFRNEP